MAVRTVTFAAQPAEGFVDTVRASVADYFQSRNLSTKANASMVLRTVTMLGLFFVPFAMLLFVDMPTPVMWGLCVVMGVALAGIGFGISHDALHGAYSGKPRVNSLLGMTFDLLGANGYMWKVTHNVIHHTYTNIHSIDEDLEVTPLLRLSPLAKRRGIHRWQHLYAIFAYSASTLNWVFWKDFDYFSRRRLGPYEGRHHPRQELARLIGFKVFYCIWAIALPLLLIDVTFGQFLTGWLTVHLVGGTILGVVFQLAHVVEQTEHPVPDEVDRMPDGWMEHEVRTTANFCTHNRLVSWYVGGLNFQIEHHLFPKVCSVHYPGIQPLVRAAVLKHGLPYHENRTMVDALRSHYRMLRRLGRGDCPNIRGKTSIGDLPNAKESFSAKIS